jgi:alanine-glyoxylate transaminase/serine-glyoxylate transaminase/serine-pyruvate transaminase
VGGRAVDPQRLRDELSRDGPTWSASSMPRHRPGVRNPVKELAAIAREKGALTIVDTVTSLGGQEVDLAGWGVDVAYSCSQKCIGAPSALRRWPCLALRANDWSSAAAFTSICASSRTTGSGGKYHHTMCTSLIYALREALQMVEEEGLPARQARHERHHLALAAGVDAMGLSLLPPAGERLWTLNTVRVPPGVDEAAIRKTLLTTYNIEVGAGLGPLAGKIGVWD